MAQMEDIDDLRYLNIPEKWLAANEFPHLMTDPTFWNDTDTFDTSNPGWDTLFRNKNLEEINNIVENIISITRLFIRRVNFSALDTFCYYYGTTIFESILQSCPQITSIVVREFLFPYNLFEIAHTCTNIIEFRVEKIVDDLDDVLKTFFRNNLHLKYLELPLKNVRGSSLLELIGKPIEELIITSVSMNATNHLVTVLNEVKTLKTLEIHGTWPTCVILLINAICKCSSLQNITLSAVTVYDILTRAPSIDIMQVVKITLTSERNVDDDMLGSIVSGLPQLQTLDISGCSRVTDEGLTNISKLKQLKELNISLLRITGESLKEFDTLEKLECQGSSVFDLGLCSIIYKCDRLKLLDIKSCENVSRVTIKTAIHIISERSNGITLKLMADSVLSMNNAIKAPELLELIYEHYNPGSAIMYPKFYAPTGVTYNGDWIFSDPRVAILDIGDDNLKVPYLHTDCLIHISNFLPIIKRIAMERVSIDWNESINLSWKSLKSLDLSTPCWTMLFFKKKIEEIDFILEKVLKRIGKYLKHIELRERCSMKMIIDNCPRLESINIYFQSLTSSDLEIMTKVDQKFTQVSLNVAVHSDSILTRIIKRNQAIKSLKINAAFYLYEFIGSLNPLNLEKLYMYQHFEMFDINIARAVFEFKNLQELALIVCSGTNDLIKAIGDCKKLKFLALQPQSIQNCLDFSPIVQLILLEKLCLLYCSIRDTFLNRLIERCNLLSYIDLTGCDLLTDVGLNALTVLKNLHTLILNYIDGIDGSGLSTLSGNNFKRLECQGCESMENESLCNILNNCSQLEFLNIVGCRKVGKRFIDRVLQVIDQRSNNIVLKLMANVHLVNHRRTTSPPLLKFIMVNNWLHKQLE